MGGVINLKKCSMVFENNGTQVIVPLDPAESTRYTEPARDEEEVDHIYKFTTQDEDWITPWRKEYSVGKMIVNDFPTPMGN